MKMIKISAWTLLASAALFAEPSVTVAQTQNNSATQKTQNGKSKSNKSKKKNKNLYEITRDAAVDNLFPNWKVPKFNWAIDPLAGYEMRKISSSDSSGTTYRTELGLLLDVVGIPFDPNNPGFVGFAGIGGTFGAQASTNFDFDGADTPIDGYSFTRAWGHFGTSILYKQYKHTFTLGRGIIENSDSENQPTVTQNTFEYDFGVLFYSWISGHYTFNLDVFDRSDLKYVFITEQKHWFHARMFTTFANSYFDLGPGFANTEQNDGTNQYEQSNTFFLALLGMNPFWKFVAKSRAKYIFKASNNEITPYPGQLPMQQLNQPSDTALPEDSFVLDAFVGFERIWNGFGIGYQISLTEYNVSSDDKVSSRQQGFTFAYKASY